MFKIIILHSPAKVNPQQLNEREKRAAPLGRRVRLSLFYGVSFSVFPTISTGSLADSLSIGMRIAQ